MNDLLRYIEKADRWLFTLVNKEFAAEWLDGFMKLLRTPVTWIPVYLFLLYWFYKRTPRYLVLIILFSLIAFAIADFISVEILKSFFERLRPCYVPDLNVRSVVDCGGKFGLPSSHASNHFALSSFWFFVISDLLKRKIYWLWLWAIAVCYAQVYVGVHYPSDVIGGAILGFTIGYFCILLFRFVRLRFHKIKNDVSLPDSS